jgi:hypothetical protein
MTNARLAAPAATSPEEPEGEVVECFTAHQILAIAREHAAFLDPRHKALYASLPAERFYDAAGLVADFIVVFQTFLDRPRRRWSRDDAATVRQLAESANEVELVCALAWTHLAYRVLPGRIPPRKNRVSDA